MSHAPRDISADFLKEATKMKAEESASIWPYSYQSYLPKTLLTIQEQIVFLFPKENAHAKTLYQDGQI